MNSYPWLSHYASGVPAEINPDTYASIPALFDTVAEKFGSNTALVCLNKKTSYNELIRLSKDFAGYLQSLPGIGQIGRAHV